MDDESVSLQHGVSLQEAQEVEEEMKETSKAMARREKDKTFPWFQIFHGEGIDVGAGDDPLFSDFADWFTIPFNLPDNGGDRLTDFFSPGFKVDFIHGSQVPGDRSPAI